MNDKEVFMTEAQAEQILMAYEVGLFRGTRSELTHARLLIAGREIRINEEISSKNEQ